MILEIFIAFGTVLIVLYLFNLYIQWSISYRADAELNDGLKNQWQNNFVLPKSLEDSLKYVNFWITYIISKK